jgi:hypothetical protein
MANSESFYCVGFVTIIVLVSLTMHGAFWLLSRWLDRRR